MKIPRGLCHNHHNMGVACHYQSIYFFTWLKPLNAAEGHMQKVISHHILLEQGRQYVAEKPDFYALKTVTETASFGNPLGLVTTRIAKRRF